MATITPDRSRFKKIIRGKIKKNLRKFISSGEMIGKKGKETVSIPMPRLDLPRFQFGGQEQGGVGQGEGEVGDSLGQGEKKPGEGSREAGKDPGDHLVETELSIDELAEILGEELELPNIEPKEADEMTTEHHSYKGISTVGPDALRHGRRTYKEALKRQISSGVYNPSNPIITPRRSDYRYRSQETVTEPQTSCVCIFLLDVSGSMGAEQKEMVRICAFWISTWLRSQYKDLECRYIIHDAQAREVDEDTFFTTRESGGTIISSAYEVCIDMIEKDYPSNSWNVYPFHFSDGDNWSGDDTDKSLDLIRDKILPRSNLFCYGQVTSPYGSGQFIESIQKALPDEPNVITSRMDSKEDIVGSIKDFLGKGK